VPYDVYQPHDGPIGSAATPERQLWCAVIGRALDDAMDHIATVSGPNERLNIRNEARAWFHGNGPDFRVACESAGYDPDCIRSRVLTMFANRASPDRAAPVRDALGEARQVAAAE
jgi:hypothetical protein